MCKLIAKPMVQRQIQIQTSAKVCKVHCRICNILAHVCKGFANLLLNLH